MYYGEGLPPWSPTTVTILRSGEKWKNHCKFIGRRDIFSEGTGSRPEGFALSHEYVHDPPDLDIMYLYGGEWCVHVPRMCIVNETTEQTYLEMNTDGWAPGYCQIHIKGTHKLLRPAQKCSYIYLRIIENALKWAFTISYLIGTLFRDPTERRKVLMSGVGFCVCFALTAKVTRYILRRVFSPYLFLEHDGKRIVLPQEFLRQLSLPFHVKSEKFQGPSHAILDLDVVPGLICLQHFPCIGQYLMRARSSLWPTPNALIQIASMPGVIVPTGKKGSPNYHFEWRFSFSVQEICLASAMPEWVKTGYRVFKYTMKYHLSVLRSSNDPTNQENVNLNSSIEHLVDEMMSGYTQYLIGLQQNSVFHREKDAVDQPEGSVCSFHFKTILLWSLEDPDTWEKTVRFGSCFVCFASWKVIWCLVHYLITSILFENVSIEDLAFTRACVVEILRDPIAAICHTSKKQIDDCCLEHA